MNLSMKTVLFMDRMTGITEDSVRFAHSGPSHNLLRPAMAELVSCGPLPLSVSAGGHASVIPVILRFFKNTVTYLAAELSRWYTVFKSRKFMSQWYEKGDGQSVVIPKKVA